MHRRRGFSLLEIMFVVVIVGILLAMGVGQYRRMQDNNSFTMEVERVAGEIRAAMVEAKAVGLPPTATAGSGTATQSASGRFRWRTFKNGQVIKEGVLGERQDVTVTWPSSMNSRNAGSVGAWFQLERRAANGSYSPVMQVIFLPDGTPLDSGDLTFRNRQIGRRLKIGKMGNLEGPLAD